MGHRMWSVKNVLAFDYFLWILAMMILLISTRRRFDIIKRDFFWLFSLCLYMLYIPTWRVFFFRLYHVLCTAISHRCSFASVQLPFAQAAFTDTMSKFGQHGPFAQMYFLLEYGDVIKWKHFPRYWPFVREIHRSLVNFPHKERPVTRSFATFFNLRLYKRFSEQSRGWWFEMPSHSLWRHCNDE